MIVRARSIYSHLTLRQQKMCIGLKTDYVGQLRRAFCVGLK